MVDICFTTRLKLQNQVNLSYTGLGRRNAERPTPIVSDDSLLVHTPFSSSRVVEGERTWKVEGALKPTV